MNFQIVNNIPNAKIVFNKKDDGSYYIELLEEKQRALGDVACGETVKIGNREFIILDQNEKTTAVIAKRFAKTMEFGEDGNYLKSDVRKYCNGDFFKELASAVGEDNIVPHTAKLVADDGTGNDVICKDKVSILTTDMYRRYRKYFPGYGEWWWLATRLTADNENYARNVCCVDANGILDWLGCGCYSGVRPFCILNSSVLVS